MTNVFFYVYVEIAQENLKIPNYLKKKCNQKLSV